MADSRSENKKAVDLISRFKRLDVKKKIQYLIIILIVIVILAIYFASAGEAQPKAEPLDKPQAVTISGDNDVEHKLKCILSRIEGAGEVEVMITYETGTEIVPAISVDTQTTTKTDTRDGGASTTDTQNTQSEIVTIGGSGGSSALVIKEKSPIVKGVIVVAQGADDIAVKLNLLKAVQTILNVGPHQVDVYKMK
ncbi:MAG: hypothetical protein WDA65_01595 [Christensenellales bacterium]